MGAPDSGSCPMTDVSINGVHPQGSATIVSIN
jgi:hypothetical protein